MIATDLAVIWRAKLSPSTRRRAIYGKEIIAKTVLKSRFPQSKRFSGPQIALKTTMNIPAQANVQKTTMNKYVFHNGHLATRLRSRVCADDLSFAVAGVDVE